MTDRGRPPRVPPGSVHDRDRHGLAQARGTRAPRTARASTCPTTGRGRISSSTCTSRGPGLHPEQVRGGVRVPRVHAARHVGRSRVRVQAAKPARTTSSTTPSRSLQDVHRLSRLWCTRGARNVRPKSLPLKRGLIKYTHSRGMDVQIIIGGHKEHVLSEQRGASWGVEIPVVAPRHQLRRLSSFEDSTPR